MGDANKITGYGEHRELYRISTDEILYFEAVGEKVFAYTEQEKDVILEKIKKEKFTIQRSKGLGENEKFNELYINRIEDLINNRYIGVGQTKKGHKVKVKS